MEDDIEFEDLHGTRGDDPGMDVEIDLDANTPGVSRKPRVKPGGDDDQDAEFDDLPANRRAEPSSDGQGDEPGDEPDKFSKKFQNRLKRERRAKQRERERAAKLEQENRKLQARLKQQDRSSSAEEIAQLDSKIATAEADLEKALEDGDSKQQVRLTSQLTDLKAKRIAAEYTRPDDDPDDGGDGDTRSTTVNPLVTEYLESHSDWYQQPGFERYTRMLRKLDREVYDDGFSPQDEEYFEELQERLKKSAPELFDEDGEVDVDGLEERRKELKAARDKDKRERNPVAPSESGKVARSPDGGQPVGNKVKLEKEDFQTMRKFGLDTSDPDVLAEFARNKRQRLLEEANG